jgi:hypothetical protein
MVKILTDKKRCPACGTANKIDATFCVKCGVNVREYEPSIIEVTDSGKITFYIMLCIISFVLFWLGGMFISFFGISIVSIIIFSIFLIIFVPILIFKYITLSKTCRFAISNEKIEYTRSIKKPPLKLYWSEFDSIELKVGGTRSYSGLEFSAGPSDTRTLRIQLLREGETVRYAGFKFFHDKKVRQVLNLIIDHAKMMNKNISASRRARKYYKLKI